MKKQSKLDRLSTALVNVQHKINTIEEDNEGVFTRHRTLVEEKEGLIEQIKVEARRYASEGETTALIESANLSVIVVGKRRPIIFNVDKAMDVLDEARLIKLVDRIDPKKVDKALREGLIEKEEVADFQEYGEMPTAAVMVKVS